MVMRQGAQTVPPSSTQPPSLRSSIAGIVNEYACAALHGQPPPPRALLPSCLWSACAMLMRMPRGFRGYRPSSANPEAMEHYSKIETTPTPSGALGQMLVVEGVEEKQIKKFVLKKAMVLLKLQHPNICAYKEFFIIWDKQTSSIILCVVMEHEGQGDLSFLIQDKRIQHKAMEEMVVQRLLGYSLDALGYMHKQNIIHRNLKPTNILLTEKDSFMITDLTLETLMNDEMKLKIRVEEGQKSWMAPEALSFIFSEKSDVWSLGCIVLEMMTCSTLRAVDIAQLLCDLRKDHSCLLNILNTLQEREGYSEPLCSILLKMLQICPEERATVIDLLDIPYVKECLALVEPRTERKKRLPNGITNILYEGGIEISLEFMEFYEAFEDAQIAALQHLAKFAVNPDALSYLSEIVLTVSNAMKKHTRSLEVQLEGCKVMYEIVSQVLEHRLNEKALNNKRLISAIVEILKIYSHHEKLLSLSCRLLMMLSASDLVAELLGKAGVVSEVLKVLQHFSADRNLCLSCMGVLWGVAVNDRNTRRVSVEGAVQTVYDVMRLHFQDGEVVESACCALWGFSLQGCFHEEQYEKVTLVLLESLETYTERPVLVNNASLTLASLLRISEVVAMRIIVPVSGVSGINVIKDSYHLHFDNPEVVENILLLFTEMLQHEATVLELLSYNVEELLREVKVKNASTEDIVVLADTALLKLQQNMEHSIKS
ncbi:serine/threonine kinase-like domain-containing protein STKLD1 isoform X2 [Rhinatrema bivittatum]|uniref:serine/threonine kinase-like domain-containing protein STKLD1 isoform X2 n=1 Tax=Rhinatrema bivittatum TaxID=194408 RepID=UPI00112A8FA3|nr:serine/threonine kinase-like domain-containing protein STKLD1 isoform X2 [Rhinatrema bivittatum]